MLCNLPRLSFLLLVLHMMPKSGLNFGQFSYRRGHKFGINFDLVNTSLITPKWKVFRTLVLGPTSHTRTNLLWSSTCVCECACVYVCVYVCMYVCVSKVLLQPYRFIEYLKRRPFSRFIFILVLVLLQFNFYFKARTQHPVRVRRSKSGGGSHLHMPAVLLSLLRIALL